MRLIIILAVISIISIAVTSLLDYLFKNKRYVKYIPAIILLPFMLYNFITMYTVPSEGFEALGRFVMGLLILPAVLSILISAIALDTFLRKRK
jgi:hypothetical protein